MKIYAGVMILLFFCLLPVAIRLDRRARVMKLYKAWARSVEAMIDSFNKVGKAAVLTNTSFKKLTDTWVNLDETIHEKKETWPLPMILDKGMPENVIMLSGGTEINFIQLDDPYQEPFSLPSDSS